MRYLLFIIIMIPQIALAGFWSNLWLTPNQQAAALLKQHHAASAAKKFENPQWKGVANYRAGNYKQAAAYFSKNNTAVSNYNLGNALAKMGDYQKAISAYNKALQQQPNFKAAIFNKKLIEKLLQQSKTSPNNKNNKTNKKSQKKNQQAQNQQGKHNNQDKNNSHQKQQSNSKQKKPNQQKNNTNKQPNKQQEEKNNKATKLSEQKQQSIKQWLRQIPDDPGGLLRQKFLRDHLRLQRFETNHDS